MNSGLNSLSLKIVGSGSNSTNVPFGSVVLPLFLLQPALLERRFGELPIPMAADGEVFRQRVDGLSAHPVEADAELEDLAVVFGAGVDLRDAVHNLAQRNAPAEIPHAHAVALDIDFDLLAETHDELVNRVVDDLLQQDVTTVVVVRTGADAPDIHARAQADVLDGGERLDLALVVVVLRRFFFGHVSRG